MDPTEAAATPPGVASPQDDLRSVGRWADWHRAQLEEVTRRLRELLVQADAEAAAATRAAGAGRPVGRTPLTVDELATVVDCVLTAARVRAEGGVPRGWGATTRGTPPEAFEC